MSDEHEPTCIDSRYSMNHKGDYSWEEYDAQGIYLCRVCDYCEKERLSLYRPEILSGYSQEDVDERIEETW